MDESDLQQHAALKKASGFVDLSGRSQIELRGNDRARLLHGLCTADIKALQPGQGCEAFLTNGQGKTIGYIYVFCESDRLVVDSVAGQAQQIIASLDRYVIREDVAFLDMSSQSFEFVVAGPQSAERLQSLFGVAPAESMFANAVSTWHGSQIFIRRVPYIHPSSYFVAGPRDLAAVASQELLGTGMQKCRVEVAEVLRIESGSPLFGLDLNADTLPQEVDRSQAISFTKGCYLGQETVARIDALGHVNWLLRGIRFSGERVPPPETELLRDEKVVARLKSTCWSLRWNAPLALAYVRRGVHEPGTRLASEWGPAEVLQLPPQ